MAVGTLVASLVGGVALSATTAEPASAAASPSQQWATSVAGTGTPGVAGSALTFGFGTSGISAVETTTAVTGQCLTAASGTAFSGVNGTQFFSPTPPSGLGIANGVCWGPAAGGGNRVSTLEFSKPVIAPVIHLQNLDASNLTISGTSTTGAPITLTPLARNNTLEITGGTLNSTLNLARAGGCEANNGTNGFGACGSVRISAASGAISSLQLVNTTDGSTLPDSSNDSWAYTLSYPTLPLTKAFSPASIPAGGTSDLTFTITNPTNEAQPVMAPLDFTDVLPAGVTLANATTTISSSCGAPTVTGPGGAALAAGATSITAAGISVAPGATCTITVTVTSDTVGTHVNNNENLSTSVANLVPNANTSLTVTAVPQPFACDANGYLFQNPVPGVNLVQSVDLVTGEYETIFTTPTPLNGVGYNTVDNFFYGLTTGTNVLNRIGADGSVKDLGAVPGLPEGTYIVGDFDNAGQYWVLEGTLQAHQIDLVPGSATYGTVVNTVPMTMPAGITSMNPDWGYIDGAFYATGTYPNGDNVLLRFDPTTGIQTLVAPLSGPDGSTMSGLVTGAVYVDAAGYLYGSNNADGNIYRINTTTGATILLAAGPAAGGNDGARCASAPIPTMTVTKTVVDRQVPADQFTVSLLDPAGTAVAGAATTGQETTVSTVNQPVSQGATYTITDTMAAGSASAINAYTAGIACTNTVTGAAVPAEGTGPWSVTIPAAADFTCVVTNAAIPMGVELVKTADAAAQENIEAGQVITYSFEFTNTGDVPLTDIRIDETEFTGTGTRPVVTCPAGTVAPDSSVTCTATYTVTQADVDAGTISNEATGTGTPPEGFPVPPVSPPSKVTVPNEPAPGISVVKSADAAAVADIAVGQEVAYSFLVKNTGNVTLANVTVTDDEESFTGSGELSAIVCAEGAGSLAPGAEVLCTASYTITQADVDAGTVTNTATVTGTPPGTTTPPVSPPSTVTVPGTPAPAVTVVKSADTAAQDAIVLGQDVTYSFLVTNTGNVTLSEVSVVEGEFTGSGELSDVACPAGSLAPGASVTCTAGYTITQADVDAGTVTNTATVTGTPPGTTTPPVSPPSTVTVPGDPAPGLAIVKTASAGTVTAAGQEIAYSFVLTNTGTVTLSDAAVVEGEFTGTGDLSDVTCAAGAGSLAPGAQVTCTATYTATQADVDAGSISNTATGTATTPGGDPVTTDPSTSTVEFPATPGISVVKSADAAAQSDIRAGQDITYSFLVTNTGNVTLSNVTVDEGEFTGAGNLSEVNCPAGAGSLAPGAEVLCTATYTVVQADVDAGTITNTATATGTPARGDVPVSPKSDVQVPSAISPALTLVKTASAETVTAAGQDVSYSFLLTNTGNVTLSDVTAVEGEFTGTGDLTAVTCPDAAASLAPGASVTCTAGYTTTTADLTAETISNTATGTAGVPGGGTFTSDPSTAEITINPAATPEIPAPGDEAPAPAPAPAGTAPAKDALADTGLTTGPLALGALLLLLLGAGAVTATKIRNRTEA